LAAPFLVLSSAYAQNPLETQDAKQQEGAQSPAKGGASTGAAHSAVLDAEKRPITAGGFVKTGPIVFQNIAATAGLTTWHHKMGSPEKKYILDTAGSQSPPPQQLFPTTLFQPFSNPSVFVSACSYELYMWASFHSVCCA
jgi:hypothetical protein